MSEFTMETSYAQPKMLRLSIGLIVGSGVAFALGLATTPEAVWPNLLLICFFLVGIGLAGMLFLALTRVTGARWCDTLQPVPAAMARTFPVAALMLGCVVIIGMSHYPWDPGYSAPQPAGTQLAADAHSAGHGDSFWFKDLWLTPTFFIARSIAYIVVFSLFALAMGCRRKKSQAIPVPLAASFIVVFAIVFSLAGIDWVMSLTPEWFSTMWGVYQFSGIFLTGLAVITLVAVFLKKQGLGQHAISDDQLHVLGILTFGFSCFWMYIWFSQYMLIWYSNIPEETFYFVDRTRGAWATVFVANIFLNWVIPFAVLISRPAKRSATVMTRVAIVILIGRWLDLYLMMLPSEQVRHPSIGFCEAGSILGTIGLFLLLMVFVHRKDDLGILPGHNAI